jgi:hypothetical protein
MFQQFLHQAWCIAKLELANPDLSFKDFLHDHAQAMNNNQAPILQPCPNKASQSSHQINQVVQNSHPDIQHVHCKCSAPGALDSLETPTPTLNHVTSSGTAEGLIQPKAITSCDLKQLKDNKAALKIRITQILEYIKRRNLQFPHDFSLWMLDLEALAWCDGYFKDPDNQPFQIHEFLKSFERLICSEVRPASSVAHTELLSGYVQQGNDNVAQYIERFRHRVSALGPNHQFKSPTLCTFFLRGLRPEIREPCILDPEFNEWSDLARLMHHACGQEDFLRAKSRHLVPLAPPAAALALGVPDAKQKWKHEGKRRRIESRAKPHQQEGGGSGP